MSIHQLYRVKPVLKRKGKYSRPSAHSQLPAYSLRIKGKAMLMDTSLDIASIVVIARTVIEQIAPEELSSFAEISEDFVENPKRVIRRRSGRSEIGFTPEELEGMITSLVLLILYQTFMQTTVDAAESVVQDAFRRLNKLWKKPKPEKQSGFPAYSEEQLKHLRQTMLEAAEKYNLAPTKREPFVDTVIRCLALRQAPVEKTK